MIEIITNAILVDQYFELIFLWNLITKGTVNQIYAYDWRKELLLKQDVLHISFVSTGNGSDLR